MKYRLKLTGAYLKRRATRKTILTGRNAPPIVTDRSLQPPVSCFRGASAKPNVFLSTPSRSANPLTLLLFFYSAAQQKLLASAFGGQHSIQLSYGCRRKEYSVQAGECVSYPMWL